MSLSIGRQQEFLEWIFNRALGKPTMLGSEYIRLKSHDEKLVWLWRKLKYFLSNKHPNTDFLTYKTLSDFEQKQEAALVQSRFEKYLMKFKEWSPGGEYNRYDGCPLEVAVKRLGGSGKTLEEFFKDAELTPEAKRKILSNPPRVYFGASKSDGHIYAEKNAIIIDPLQAPDEGRAYDTLAFEVWNSSLSEKYKTIKNMEISARAKAFQKLRVEFKVSQEEIARLLRRKGCQTYKQLVEQLGIDPEILHKYPPIKKSEFNPGDLHPLDTPSYDELPRTTTDDTDKRTALFWFRVAELDSRQQFTIYARTDHNPANRNVSSLDHYEKDYSKVEDKKQKEALANTT